MHNVGAYVAAQLVANPRIAGVMLLDFYAQKPFLEAAPTREELGASRKAP